MKCDRKPSMPGTGDRRPSLGWHPIRSYGEAAQALGMTANQLRHAEQKVLAKLREGLTALGYDRKENR